MTVKPTILTGDIQDILDGLKHKSGALLPILHALQDHYGFIPSVSVPMIADALNISTADVQGVITFYHFFRTSRGGKTTIHICRAEACQSRGSRETEAYIKQKLDIDFHQTTDDGAFSLEPVYCLGNCTCGPNLRVGDDIHARMSKERVDDLLTELGREAG
ncbi:formate dehydrogenase subunit gamma [Endozoicomonadaceae bacterium StTr2]